MIKKAKLVVYFTLVFFIFSSGIYRHDVNVQDYIDLGKEPQFNCVGQLVIAKEPKASCVLVQERFVLTAAHNLVLGEAIADTTMVEGKQVILYTEDNLHVLPPDMISVKFGDKEFGVKGVTIHPFYLHEETKGSCDIALIELAEPAQDILTPKLNDKPDEWNSFVIGVGFGVSGPANRPDLVSPKNKKIAGQNVIDSIGGFELSGLKTLLFADFDHPADTTCCNRMGSPIPQPLEFMISGGDSGGGLFRYNNNEWELIGITSGGGIDLDQFMKSFYYGQVGAWTRVSALHEWISENI